MHIFVDTLLPCARTVTWPYDESCHLLSDSLSELTAFARHLRLHPDWLQWSRQGLPHFDLTRGTRLKALLAGAHEISREEVADLNHFWVAHNNALLSRLLKPVPYLACRLAVRPLSKLPPPKNPF